MSTTTSSARYGYCQQCGRPLKHPGSKARGCGPTCWKAYLASLSENDRARETMRGYNWYKDDIYYIVVTPEHKTYRVEADLPDCECLSFAASSSRTCKHILYIRREIGFSAPEATESQEDGVHVELNPEYSPSNYAIVREDEKTYRVNWQRPFCTCPGFAQDHEICTHIRAAQDEANRVAETRRAQAETPEARRARVQRDIDAVFDER